VRHDSGCPLAGDRRRTVDFRPGCGARRREGVARFGPPALQGHCRACQWALDQASGTFGIGSGPAARRPWKLTPARHPGPGKRMTPRDGPWATASDVQWPQAWMQAHAGPGPPGSCHRHRRRRRPVRRQGQRRQRGRPPSSAGAPGGPLPRPRGSATPGMPRPAPAAAGRTRPGAGPWRKRPWNKVHPREAR
jgi:hypothetical protein